MSRIVLFHGMTGTPAELLPLAEVLNAQGHAVDLPRLPGHQDCLSDFRRTGAHAYLQACERALFAAVEGERGAVVVGGLSLGSLLALYLAGSFPAVTKGVVLMSCPLRFRHWRHELALRTLSYAPEWALNLLPLVRKAQRKPEVLVVPREGFSKHSIGAAARLIKLRRLAVRSARRLKIPALLLQDPLDHHIHPGAIGMLRVLMPQIEVHLIPGGEHELTLGRKREEVYVRAAQFVEKLA